jgi:hypothetical protein
LFLKRDITRLRLDLKSYPYKAREYRRMLRMIRYKGPRRRRDKRKNERGRYLKKGKINKEGM